MDDLIRDKVHRSFTFLVATVPDYSTALAVEGWVKSGAADCGPPLGLNAA
jgi:hypothetical protein